MRRVRFVPLFVAFLAASLLAVLPADPARPSGTQLPPTAAAEDEALVEIHLADRLGVDSLVNMGADLAEYLRENEDGTVTVNAFVTPTERLFLETAGYRFGATIEDRDTWEARKAEREEAIAAEQGAHEVAEKGPLADLDPSLSNDMMPRALRSGELSGGPPNRSASGEEEPPGEVSVMRADYFVHRSGRFLSVEARTSLGTTSGGPTMAMSWAEEGGEFGTATTMSKFNDSGAYMYHRTLTRVGAAGSETPVPAIVRVASSTGDLEEREVRLWPGPDLPPYAEGYLSGFFTHYMDPVEVYDRINDLATEFPNLAEIIDLPHLTGGYQRKAMAMMEGATGTGSAPTDASRAVLLLSNAYGHEGGNDVQAEFLLGVPPPTSTTVTVAGSRITVNLALNTTAAQVVQAINADPAAGALVTAQTYGNNAGGGIVPPHALVNLDDFLNAPDSIPRGQFQPQAIRIGKHRDGSKVGVFLYCQQHAREWVTPLTCVETAERLLRNYAIDPGTQELVDNLDVFIIPSYNPDGSLYSFYDFASQRKNLTRYCALTATNGMPSSRNSWGVDLNRNNTVGTLFDGYSGASSSCTSAVFAGPSELSEPENQNERWIIDTFDNIRFSNNIHSYGGYFMWAPGAYVSSGRVTLPAPNIGVEGYFFEGAKQILSRIEEYRGTVILPSRTGPVADVLYSAAGNSADEQWYRKDIIAYSFETGADLFTSDAIGTSQSAVGFMPNYESEGQHEAMEFAAGNYGLLETALAYANDNEPPVAEVTPNGALSGTPIDATFSWVNEPSVIHYTLDGSTPTTDSPTWEGRGPRQPGEWLRFEQTTTLKWIAVDIRGNQSEVGSARFVIDTVPPTTSATLSSQRSEGVYVNPTITLEATDDVEDGGAGVDYSEYRLDGGEWTIYAEPFSVGDPGDHILEYRSADLAGNIEETRSLAFNVMGCTITGTEADDILVGTDGADVICGLGGNDIIDGLGGNDLILGGGGVDRVKAGSGNDEVVGGAADDDLKGERGDDILRGGSGFDLLNGAQGFDLCSVDEDGGRAAACEG